MARPSHSRNHCCRRCHRQLLLKRSGALRDAAAAESEETLLRAATWLETRASRGVDPALSLEVALHFLVLAENVEVKTQAGLAARYLRKADEWIHRAAELGNGILTLAPDHPNA